MSEVSTSRAPEGDAERLAQQRERARGCFGCSGCLGMFFSIRNWIILGILSLPGDVAKPRKLLLDPQPPKTPTAQTVAEVQSSAPRPYASAEAATLRPLIQRWVMFQDNVSAQMDHVGIPRLGADFSLGQAQVVNSWKSDIEASGIQDSGLPAEMDVLVVETGPGSGPFAGRTWYFCATGDIFVDEHDD